MRKCAVSKSRGVSRGKKHPPPLTQLLPNDTLAVYSPDTMMAGVARYRERYMSYANFFDQVRATAGTHAL